MLNKNFICLWLIMLEINKDCVILLVFFIFLLKFNLIFMNINKLLEINSIEGVYIANVLSKEDADIIN